jgi:hypothetical protein
MLFSPDLMTFRMLRELSASSRRVQISHDTDVSNPDRFTQSSELTVVGESFFPLVIMTRRRASL